MNGYQPIYMGIGDSAVNQKDGQVINMVWNGYGDVLSQRHEIKQMVDTVFSLTMDMTVILLELGLDIVLKTI